jgi:hypothetical protein
MIIRKESIAAVLQATTADDGRYFLRAVQFEPANHRVVATNGHVMLLAQDNAPHADADFPIIPGAAFHGDPTAPVLIETETLKGMLAVMPKRATLPILHTVQLSQNGSPTTATLAATDLQAPRVATIESSGQTFPAYGKIMDRCESIASANGSVSITLAVDVLETLIKAAKAAYTTKRKAMIRFDIPANDKKEKAVNEAIYVTIKGDDITVTGAAMPCRA